MNQENEKNCFDNRMDKQENFIEGRAYKQWVKFHIKAVNEELTIQNATLSWGKFYNPDNQNHEISPSKVNETKISKHEIAIIASSGRKDSPSGTQGSFDICDKNKKTLFTIYWDCPWGGLNSFSYIKHNEKFIMEKLPTQINERGDIGNVNLNVAKIWL
ncbi:aegerolysin family protein [Clostridium sp. Marseille-Q2269]|uniref:aegerolysin family protein n=1 Tax=Clostridium sp. Marseille-Q2269 TaxID=2942205 RepID=UPI0020743CE3|nr:aegerolysin family protein [Clostridium sp. Marseille-Q2269]